MVALRQKLQALALDRKGVSNYIYMRNLYLLWELFFSSIETVINLENETWAEFIYHTEA